MKIKNDNKTPHSSEEYDKKVRQTIPYYETFYNETIDLVDTINPDVNIWLDTGCGTGSLIDFAINKFPLCTFILSDPSEKMLMQCKNKLNKHKNTKIIFLDPAGTEDLQIETSNYPDVITAIQSHHYLDKQGRGKATQKCYNLLRIDGIYITFENIKPKTDSGIEYGLNRWMQFQLKQGRNNKEVAEHRKRFNTEYFPITVNDHLLLLKNVGFRIVELFWLSHMQAGFYAVK